MKKTKQFLMSAIAGMMMVPMVTLTAKASAVTALPTSFVAVEAENAVADEVNAAVQYQDAGTKVLTKQAKKTTSIKKNTSDTKALKKIVTKQNKLGAKLSKDMNSNQYQWAKNGRLTAINWNNCGLKGKLTVKGLSALKTLNVSNNKALTSVNAPEGKLETVDASGNKAMTGVYVYDNQLTALKLNGDTSLDTVSCSNNKLTSIDLSSNKALTNLFCTNNQLKKLDITANQKLDTVWCYDNQLTTLDASKNTKIETLSCQNNQLTKLNIKNATKLKWLTCDNNKLTELNTADNTSLGSLSCQGNQIKALDFTNNTELYDVFCDESVTLTGVPVGCYVEGRDGDGFEDGFYDDFDYDSLLSGF